LDEKTQKRKRKKKHKKGNNRFMGERFDSDKNSLDTIPNKHNSSTVDIIGEKKSYQLEELNELTYCQALENDKRNLVDTFFCVFKLKIDIIQILFYPEEFTHFSILISCYCFGLLIDLTLNVLFFSDDIISQKYNNNGNLLLITTIVISLISNVFSNFILYFVEKLINYNEILKIISNEIKDRKMYYLLFVRQSKTYKKKIFVFFIMIFIIGLCFVYYIFLFSAIYKNMQIEIWKNYFSGVLESLLYTLILSAIIAIIRKISLSYRYKQLYVVSKYIDSTF